MENFENNEVDEARNNKSYNEIAEISGVEEPCGDVVISIKKMLEKLRPANIDSSICRVSKQLRIMNSIAYVPQVISIGPFQRQSKDLKATEEYKHQGLCNFLRRLDDDHKEKDRSLKELVVKAVCWVEEARKFYAEPIDMKEEEFVMLMLVDGCFIVEFFILVHDHYTTSDEHKFNQIPGNVDFLFYQEILPDVYLDLIKLENQLPFFVLQHLFDEIPKQNTPKSLIPGHESFPISFLELTFEVLRLRWVENYVEFREGTVFFKFTPAHLLQYLSLYYLSESVDKCRDKKVNYFLSFFYVCRFWNKPRHVESDSDQEGSADTNMIRRTYAADNWTKDQKQHEEKRWIPPSITELSEAGVTLKKAKKSPFIANITFKNGVLEIPTIVIDSYFETMTRNLIAYEHFYAKHHTNMNVISYVLFMDYLISTEKDVSLLGKAGIIINDIGGSDKEMSELFNTLGKFVNRPGNTSAYIKKFNHISKALCEHRDQRWNKLKASLKHNYFNTPWAGISVLAATFIILLTLLQTIFSAISTF